MDTDTREYYLGTLRQRKADIVESWYRAVGRAGYVTLLPDQVRAHLADLFERAIALVADRPLDRQGAEEVGAALI